MDELIALANELKQIEIERQSIRLADARRFVKELNHKINSGLDNFGGSENLRSLYDELEYWLSQENWAEYELGKLE